MGTTKLSTAAPTLEWSDSSKLPDVPLVSVLILAFNHAPFLAKAVESVVSQATDFDFEVLIGEDCSQDGTLDIALDLQRRHPEVIRVLTSDRNVGAYHNYLRLLHAGRGKYFAQLDGDDYWLAGKLARQVALLRELPEASAIYTNAHTVDHRGNNVGFFNDIGDATLNLSTLLRRGNCLNTSTMVYRANLATHLLVIEREYIDYDIHLLLAQHGSLVHLAEPLAAYRVNSPGAMVASSNEKVRDLYWQAILNVPRSKLNDIELAWGIADFLRRVFFRSMKTRDPTLLLKWVARTYPASPYGGIRTSALVALNILRMIGKMLLAHVPFLGNGKNVLYRH